MHRASRKYLRFCIRDHVFQFRALPFGLTTSPYVFTQLMTAIAIHLRKRAITLVSISGRLVSKKSESSNPSKGQTVYPSIDHVLGTHDNREKSELIPAQTFVFIGIEFLTVENIVRIPLDKVQSVLEFLNWFLKQSSVSARVFLSLLGWLNATAQFVILGRLHLRPLQMALFTQWKPHVLPLTHKIMVSHQIKHHLKWWTNKDRFIQGVPVKPVQEMPTLFTDAIVLGWGAHLEPEGLLFQGVWTKRPIPTPYQCPRNDGYFHGSGKSTSCNRKEHIV